MLSNFPICECCAEGAKRACNCSSPPRFFCDIHAFDHINSEKGVHQFDQASVDLSDEDVYQLTRAVQSYQLKCIRQAISKRNEKISSFLQGIKEAEKECSKFIKTVLKEDVKKTVEQLISKKTLPVFSACSFLRSLVSLKQSQAFFLPYILKEVLCFSSYSPPSLNQIFSSLADTPPIIHRETETVKPKEKEKEKEIEVDPVPQWDLSDLIDAHTRNRYSGSPRQITSIALSDCHQYFASAGYDKTIKVWKTRNCDLVRSLEGHSNYVTSVCFLGHKIVSGSWDNSIKIWEEERCINTLSFHSYNVNSVCVSSCKRLIASGSDDRTVIIFDVENNELLHTLRSHSLSVTSVAFSEDDEEIISGSWDKTVKIWKTETGELLKTLNGHIKPVFCVRVSGKLILSSSEDKSIRIWEKDKEESLLCLKGHTSSVKSIDIFDNIVASIGNDKKIRLWSLDNGKQIQVLEGHGSSGICYIGSWWEGSLRILDEGRFIVSGGADGKIKIWKRRN